MKARKRTRLSPKQVKEIFLRSRKGELVGALSYEFGVIPDTIAKIKYRVSWRYITDKL